MWVKLKSMVAEVYSNIRVRLGWMIIGILAPELLLAVAWTQLVWAKRILKAWNELVPRSEKLSEV